LCCSDVIFCVVHWLIVLFYVVLVCKCVLPQGDNPIAVNKYYYYNLETLTVLVYSLRDSKYFALLIKRLYLSWPIPLETLRVSPF